jgi:hypothetical protein
LFIHGHESHLSTCVDTQSPKYLEMAQGHISLSDIFTKPLDEQTFTKLRHELNILDSRNFD